MGERESNGDRKESGGKVREMESGKKYIFIFNINIILSLYTI